jgi:MerR family transcriptional regulator/heat shock protein HspR
MSKKRPSDEPVYLISVAARLCGLHPQTLRLYERLGLIQPHRVGNSKRLYSEADIARLRRIQHLTQHLGVNLAGVEVILRLLERMEQMNQEMEQLVEQMNMRILQLIRDYQLPVNPEQFLIRFERYESETSNPNCRFPPQVGGTKRWFPLRSRGNTGGGSQHNSDSGSPCLQGEPTGGVVSGTRARQKRLKRSARSWSPCWNPIP